MGCDDVNGCLDDKYVMMGWDGMQTAADLAERRGHRDLGMMIREYEVCVI